MRDAEDSSAAGSTNRPGEPAPVEKAGDIGQTKVKSLRGDRKASATLAVRLLGGGFLEGHGGSVASLPLAWKKKVWGVGGSGRKLDKDGGSIRKRNQIRRTSPNPRLKICAECSNSLD
jgi:hypothetical protein